MTWSEDPRGYGGVHEGGVERGIEVEGVRIGDGAAIAHELVIGSDAGGDAASRGWRLRARGSSSSRGALGSVGSLVGGALAMSGACLAVMMAAGALRSGSAWSGINVLPSGLPLLGRRVPRFEPRLTAGGIGTVLAGMAVMSVLRAPIARTRIGGSRVGAGLFAALGSLALDRFLMRPTLLPSLRGSLGTGGMIAKYAAIGVAAALTRPPAAQAVGH